jgi:(p)ppGpp synthase/HD superfamily hydrolase
MTPRPTRKPSYNLPDPVLSARFRSALAFAAKLHARQSRKGTSRPYVAHLLGVTSTVLTHGGDEDEAIAALLHDAVEDQGGKPRLHEIRRKFGSRVAHIVDGCTDSYTEPKPPWLARKKAYLRHLRGADKSTCLVSAADKLYNAREILSDYRAGHAEGIWKRFSGEKRGTLWYYRQVSKILRSRVPKALAEELNRVVTELKKTAAKKPQRQ